MKFTRVTPDVANDFRYEEIDSDALDAPMLAAAQDCLRRLRAGSSECVCGEDDRFIYMVVLGAPLMPIHPSAPPGVLQIRQTLSTSRLHFHIRQEAKERRADHVEEPYTMLCQLLPAQDAETNTAGLRGSIIGVLGSMQRKRVDGKSRPSREEIDAALAAVNRARPGYLCAGPHAAKLAHFCDCFAYRLLTNADE